MDVRFLLPRLFLSNSGATLLHHSLSAVTSDDPLLLWLAKMSHHKPRHFYDATEPNAIPDHSLAAVYVNLDGSFAWAQAQVDRMSGVFGVSESGNPEFAKFARCVAVEPGAAAPSQAPGFLSVRAHHGHHDGMVYCNLSNWDETERACLAHGLHPAWWIAHPGGSTDVRSAHGTRPAAVQTEWTDAYDRSIILQPILFTPPSHFHATG